VQPAFDEAKENEVNSSTGPLLMLSAILMIFVLYLVFRNVRWRLFPLAVVLLGIVYTFGAMGFIGIPKSMISMAAFPILVGIGIDYIIQFHCRIEEELKHGESEEQAVIETIKHTGPAVLIALVITSLGFISLLTSPVPMIQDFGKLLLIGIFMCFIASLFVGVPVLYKLDSLGKMKIFARFRSQNDKRSDQRKKDNGPDILEKTIGNVTKLTINHPFLVLLIAGSLCIAGLYADQSVPVQTDNRKYVPQDMDALVDLNHLYDIIGGEDQINLIIKVDDNADPEVLKWVDEFSEHEVSSRSHIYSSDSIVSIVKSANGGMIPDSREEIIQIYEQMPETQKDRYVNGASMLHLSFNIGNAMDEMGLEGIGELTETIKEDISWMEAPPGISVTITGSSTVYVSVISALTSGRIQMTFLGLLLVLGGLLFIYRNPVKAFAPVITMFMVVGWTGGVMYYLGMEYTTLSATLGALILGVGSEYAILIMERYFEEKEKGAKPEEAMYEASVKIGKAIVTSGLTTLFGFSALIVSYFPITRNFGTVTVIDVGLALIATFIITPPVIVHLDKYSEKRKAKSMKTIKRQEMRTEISYKKEADF
jgi:hydrophobe/amphiphile efflux-3 (HAE3) family protein